MFASHMLIYAMVNHARPVVVWPQLAISPWRQTGVPLMVNQDEPEAITGPDVWGGTGGCGATASPSPTMMAPPIVHGAN
jgi:hypothetical protein